MNKTNNLSCFFFHNVDMNLDKTEEEFSIPTCVLNSVFSLLTCVGNFIILHAIRRASDLHSPSLILLCFLAVSDFLVSAICQPSFVAYKTAGLVDNFSVYCTSRVIEFISGYLTSGVSWLFLAAVSIDRLLALTLHLRYSAIVTIPRVFQASLAVWIFSITFVVLKFWLSYENWIFLPLVIFLVTLILITWSTFKIFQIVRRHQRQIQSQTMAATSRNNTVNVLKCKKSAVTVLYVYGLFLLFYLPFCVTMIVNSLMGYTKWVKIAYDYASTAVFVNSCLSPLVYCWRMKEVRRAVKRAYRRQ